MVLVRQAVWSICEILRDTLNDRETEGDLKEGIQDALSSVSPAELWDAMNIVY